MAEQITIARFEKVGRKFILKILRGGSMHWPDQNILEDFIDNGKDSDGLVRGLLARIRNSDPTFNNLGSLPWPIDYERPDVREVP